MTDKSPLIITVQDLYSVPAWNGKTGYCAEVSREWFAARGLSWSDFVMNGIDAEVILATGDSLAVWVVEWARSQREAEHG